MRPRSLSRFGFKDAGLALAIAVAMTGGHVRAETLDNDTVIALVGAKIGDEALIAKIDTSPCGYDVSMAQLARLKKAKVSSAVLAAMIRRCGDRSPGGATQEEEDPRAGVYIERMPGGHSELVRIEPAYVSPARGGGNGSLLFPSKSKLSLPGAAASISASAYRPVFFFFIGAKNLRRDGFGNDPTDGAHDPSGFNLVRFDVEKNERELTVETANMLGSSSNIDTRLARAFTVSPDDQGVYRVDIVTSLDPGQYGFLERLSGGTYRVYDFEIPARGLYRSLSPSAFRLAACRRRRRR
jgi:hypothetical protein